MYTRVYVAFKHTYYVYYSSLLFRLDVRMRPSNNGPLHLNVIDGAQTNDDEHKFSVKWFPYV